MTTSNTTTIGLLGFGEVGQTFADSLSRRSDAVLKAFDIQFANRDSGPARAIGERVAVDSSRDPADLASGCKLLISAVTASEDLAATESILDGIDRGCFVLDVNSVSPGTRLRCSELVESAGGRYVEAAIMSAIAPHGIASPVLLGGPHARQFVSTAAALGFARATVFSDEIGPASATKMCRSVIIKGLEALFAESLVAARHYRVADAVLASLDDLMASEDVRTLADYMIRRSIKHGIRRAEEMQQVSRTVSDAGCEPAMSDACAKRQAWAAQFPEALREDSLSGLLDTLRSNMQC